MEPQETIKNQIHAISKVWIDYKDLMIITGWCKTKSNQVLKRIQINKNCMMPFDTRKARTEIVLRELGYERDQFIKDLQADLNNYKEVHSWK